MQVNTFTNQELSICLDVLYAPNSRGHVFTCNDVERLQQFRGGIEIIGPESEMQEVLNKVKSLQLRLWTKSEPLSDIDYFYSSSNGKTRLTLTNEAAVINFQKALYSDLVPNENAFNSYTIKTEYKRSML